MADETGLRSYVDGHLNQRRALGRVHGDFQEQVFVIPVIGGSGRAEAVGRFNFAFVNVPTHHAACALEDGDVVIGATPEVSVTVIDWERSSGAFYTGARFAIHTRGHTRQRLRVTVSFTGLGLTLPLASALNNATLTDPV